MLVAQLAAAASEVSQTTALPPLGFGLVTGGILVSLLALTYAFRNAGNKH